MHLSTKIEKAIENGYLIPHRKQSLHGIVQFLSSSFEYDAENAVLFYDSSSSKTTIKVIDLCVELSAHGIEVNEDFLGKACHSMRVAKLSTLEFLISNLPEHDGGDHIQALAKYFKTESPLQLEVFLKNWLTNAVGMILEPDNISAVNRLVVCLQSENQRVGKTSFIRWLTTPFKTKYSSATVERDTPSNDKDAKIELTNNLIIVLDDIDNWSSSSIEKLKSLISSKEIKVRLPYDKTSTFAPRRASYFATTNQSGFLNESGNTRWVIFSVDEIDWEGYTKNVDATQIWAQAKSYWTSNSTHKTLSKDHVKFCMDSSLKYQIETEYDEMLLQYVGYLEEGQLTPTMIYEAMSETHRRLLGASNAALGKIGKTLKRHYGDKVARKVNGKRLYRLRLVKAERDIPFN